MSMDHTEPERSASSAPPAASDSASNPNSSNKEGGQRRRRRRRKNRGAGAAIGAGATGNGGAEGAQFSLPGVGDDQPREAVPAVSAASEGEGEAPAPASAAPAAEGNFRQGKRQGGGFNGAPREFSGGGNGANHSGGQGQNNGGKKKHWQNKGGGQGGGYGSQGGSTGYNAQGGSGGGQNRDRGFGGGSGKPQREYNPGNSIYGPGGGGGGRRKNKKGRGPGSFVGPMDHSYRAPNGNIADGSGDFRPQREVNGNVVGRNGYYDEWDMYMPVPPPSQDAPVRVVMFVEDLFVVAKTQEFARKLGIKVLFAKAEKDQLTAIMDAPETERASLIVFDLNNAGAKPLTTIPKLKAKLKRGTSIIGFLSQIQGDLKGKALEAGCDVVMHKGAFSQNLPNLLRRHGIEDEEFETVEA